MQYMSKNNKKERTVRVLTCTCGLKEKIKQRIKDLESYWVIERGNYPEWVKQGLEELKGLLE